VLVAPDLYVNAGHFTPRNGSIVAFHTELIFGENYNTSSNRYGVIASERYSGYVFGNTSTIDLGIGWTDRFVSGFTTPVTFASSTTDQQLTQVDYGNYGDRFTGELPSIGDKFAGYARTIGDSSSEYPRVKYTSTVFSSSGSNGLLNVKGLNFSSGAPWYNSNGELVGITIAGNSGLDVGITTILRFDNTEVQSYLQPLIQDSWNRYYASVPEPTSLAALAIVGTALLFRQRR